MRSLFAYLAHRASAAHIQHLGPVAPGGRNGLVARVYRQMEADFGMVAPPIALHAPAPAALAASWLMLRESLLSGGRVSRPEKEAVAAAVSLANQCPYCAEVHGSALQGLSGGPDTTAVAAGRFDEVANPQLRALARWAWASGTLGTAPAPAPFPARLAPEIVGVAVTFHYLNRMVSVFLTDSPLPPLPAPALPALRRAARLVMGALARRRPAAGGALSLLPEHPLPAELSWAAGQPAVAAAFARAHATFEAGGQRAVPAEVRRLVLATLAERTAVEPGLGMPAWVDEAVAGRPGPDQPAARLALLTAFAPFRVTERQIDQARASLDDEGLVQLTSWASFAAARAVGARLAGPGPASHAH